MVPRLCDKTKRSQCVQRSTESIFTMDIVVLRACVRGVLTAPLRTLRWSSATYIFARWALASCEDAAVAAPYGIDRRGFLRLACRGHQAGRSCPARRTRGEARRLGLGDWGRRARPTGTPQHHRKASYRLIAPLRALCLNFSATGRTTRVAGR